MQIFPSFTLMSDIKIDYSAGSQPYLRIVLDSKSEGSKPRYLVSIFEDEAAEELLYEIAVSDPLDRTSIVIQIGLQLAQDASFGFGRDNRPYRWTGARWVDCEKWFDCLGFGLFAAIRASGLTNRAESLYGITRAAWRAHTKYDADGLNLKAFGTCPGVPLSDGILVPEALAPDLDTEDVFVTNPDTGELEEVRQWLQWRAAPHSPANCNLRVLPITLEAAEEAIQRLDTEAGQASLLMKFLGDVLPPDGIVALQDWLGYHLVAGVTANSEKMMYLWGSGANGKSQVLELIRALLGKEACAEVRLSDLTIQANLEKLVGKLAMLGSEANTKSDLETLKALISREPVSCNPKYRDPFTIEPECLVTQASNYRPAFETSDNAMVRRVVALEMKNAFKDAKEGRILNIAQKILETEYELLVGFALKGALNCIARNGYEEPETVKQASRTTVQSGNFIKGFMETLEFGPYEVAELELYTAYRHWCADNGIRNVQSNTTFLADLTRMLSELNVKVEPARTTGELYKRSQWSKTGSLGSVVPAWDNGAPSRVLVRRGFRVGQGWLPAPVGQMIPAASGVADLYLAQQSLTFKDLLAEAAPPSEELPVF